MIQYVSLRIAKVSIQPIYHNMIQSPNCLAWFYVCKFHICLPLSAHGLWESFMILTLFARLTYVSILHWIVLLYYYGFLVNDGIGLILVIQTFYPSALSVFYNKDVCPTSSVVWSTAFPFIILKSQYAIYKHYHIVPILYAFLHYWYYGLYIFMYISMCLYIIVTILLWVLSIYFFYYALYHHHSMPIQLSHI